MSQLVEEFRGRGYRVFVVPEVPSILLGGGADLGALDRDGFLSFEKNLIGLQISMEEAFIDLAVGTPSRPLFCVIEERWTRQPTSTMPCGKPSSTLKGGRKALCAMSVMTL